MQQEDMNAAARILLAKHDCFSDHLEVLEQAVSGVDCSTLSPGKPTSQVEKALRESLNADQWRFDQRLTGSSPLDGPKANYLADAQSTFHHGECFAQHLLTVEFCFDNRQAIGTNFLKGQLANNAFATSEARVALTVLIVLSKESRLLGGWDPAVATYHEYRVAMVSHYAAIVTAPIGIMEI